MAKKSLKITFFFFSLFPKKINRQNKATTYKAQWTALLGLRNPINPVKVAKFALRFIYFLSIHYRFHFHFHWCAHSRWKLIHPLIFLWVVPNLAISLAASSLENHEFFVHPLQFIKSIHLTIIFIGRFLCDYLFMVFREASWKWMERLMLSHLANFTATEHNNKKQMEKGFKKKWKYLWWSSIRYQV